MKEYSEMEALSTSFLNLSKLEARERRLNMNLDQIRKDGRFIVNEQNHTVRPRCPLTQCFI